MTRMRPSRRNWIGAAAALLTAVIVAAAVPWGAGLLRFAAALPSRVDDPDSSTDAIVVLTGGSERLATGLRLLAEGKADRVLVSGVHPTVDMSRLMQLAGRPADALSDRVDSGYGARDTAGNAAETAAWMREHGYRSLRLVTGSYHMPRSLLEFREALPEARIVPHPVFPDHVKQQGWWNWPGTAALIIREYNKYLLASVEHWALPQRTDRGAG